jgi:hypothetical protein
MVELELAFMERVEKWEVVGGAVGLMEKVGETDCEALAEKDAVLEEDNEVAGEAEGEDVTESEGVDVPVMEGEADAVVVLL